VLRSVDSKAKRGEIEVFLNDNESKRKAKEVLKINSGYEFMNLSKAEINRITEAITVELVKILEKIKFTGF
jgi:TusA-related sulfurtransferase